MRFLTRLAALLVLSSLAAQEAPGLADAAPLPRPDLGGGLRGATVCVASIGTDTLPVRTTHYLARLLESAGARVAVVPASDEPVEAAADVARDAGAVLLVSIGQHGNATAVQLPMRGNDDPLAALEARLAKLTIAELSTSRPPARSRDVQSSAVPTLQVLLRATEERLAHRDAAHALIAAIAAWWKAAADAIRAAAPEPAAREHSAARRVDPTWPLDRPPQDDAEVAAFVTSWRRSGVVDSTQVYLDATVERTENGWRLTGATELPLLGRALRRALDDVGVKPLEGDLRVLPDRDRLGCEPFGIVTAPSAQTWRRPGRSTGLSRIDAPGQFEETDLLEGEPVRLLDREADHLLVHAITGYLGWAPAAAIEPCNEDRFRAQLHSTSGPRENGTSRGAAAARTALAQLGTPYLFGGCGENGIDCSGLVGAAWGAQDVFLPRDAGQQILTGHLVATAQQLAPLEPGDLLFFSSGSGRISHVGISIGGYRFVHATPPEVTVNSLDAEDPHYSRVAERFVLAKRPGR